MDPKYFYYQDVYFRAKDIHGIRFNLNSQAIGVLVSFGPNLYPMIVILSSDGAINSFLYSTNPFLKQQTFDQNNFLINIHSQPDPPDSFPVMAAIFGIRSSKDNIQALIRLTSDNLNKTNGIIEMINSGTQFQSVIEDKAGLGYYISGFYSNSDGPQNGIFVSFISKTSWESQWEVLSTGMSTTPITESISQQSIGETTHFTCGNIASDKTAFFAALDLSVTPSTPSTAFYHIDSINYSMLGCFSIQGINKTFAYSLVGNLLSGTSFLNTYILQLKVSSAFNNIFYQRYSGLEKTFDFTSSLIRDARFFYGSASNQFVYFIGSLNQFSRSNFATQKQYSQAFLMKFPLDQVNSTEYCQEFYIEYFQILGKECGRKEDISIVITNPPELSVLQDYSIVFSFKPIIPGTDFIQNSITVVEQQNRLQCNSSTPIQFQCSISLTPPHSQTSININIGDSQPQYQINFTESFIVSPNHEQCPPVLFELIIYDSSDKIITNDPVNSLIKLYESEQFVKALIVNATQDQAVQGYYKAQIKASFKTSIPSLTLIKATQDFKIRYIPNTCGTQTASLNSSSPSTQIRHQAFYSSQSTYSIFDPFTLNPTTPLIDTCIYYILVDAESLTTPAVLPSYMSQSNSLSIIIQQIPLNSTKFPSQTYNYILLAKHAKNPLFLMKSMQQVSVTIDHECQKVDQLEDQPFQTYSIVVGTSSQVLIPQLPKFDPDEDLLNPCVDYYLFYAQNNSLVSSSDSMFSINRIPYNGKIQITVKQQPLNLEPQLINLFVQGIHSFNSSKQAFFNFSVNFCGYKVGQTQILMNKFKFPMMKQQICTIGGSPLNIRYDYFQCDPNSSENFNYFCQGIIIDEMANQMIRIQLLPDIIKDSAPEIQIQTNDTSWANTIYYILVQGSLSSVTPVNYQFNLVIPVLFQLENRYSPVQVNHPEKLLNVFLNNRMTLSLGDLFKPDQGKYSVSLDLGLASSFISGQYPTLFIYPISSETKIGVYNITLNIIVIRSNPPQELNHAYIIKINVLPIPIIASVNNQMNNKFNKNQKVRANVLNISKTNQTKLNNNQVDTNQSFKAEIKKIGLDGIAQVSFNKELFVPANFSSIDKMIMDIKIKDKGDAIILWNLTSFKKTTGITIQILFKDPLSISSDPEALDFLIIEFKDPSFFVSSKNISDQIQGGTIIQKVIQRQIHKDFLSKTLIESGQILQDILNSIMYTSLAINILMSTSLQTIWALVNVMQLTVQFPLLNLTFPLNAVKYYGLLQNVSSFNILPIDLINSLMFNFTPTNVEDPHFQQMNFQSSNAVTILGSIYHYLEWSIAASILLVLVKMIRQVHEKVQQACNKLSNIIFFNMILRLIQEGYMDLCIASFLNYQNDVQSTSSDQFSYILSIIIIAIISVFPTFTLIVLMIKKQQLNEEISLNTFGALYNDLRTDSYLALLLNIIQMLRRFLIASLAIFLKKYSVLQVQLIVLQSILMLIYLIAVKPYTKPLQNKIQIFNESCILFSSYSLFFFTDYFTDPYLQYSVGWYMIGVSFFNILVNILVMLYQYLTQLKLVWVKCKQRFIKAKKHIDPAKPELNLKIDNKNQSSISQPNDKSQSEPTQADESLGKINAPKSKSSIIIPRRPKKQYNIEVIQEVEESKYQEMEPAKIDRPRRKRMFY